MLNVLEQKMEIEINTQKNTNLYRNKFKRIKTNYRKKKKRIETNKNQDRIGQDNIGQLGMEWNRPEIKF